MSREAGFSLVELLVAMAVMLVIAGAATTALLKMGTTQATIWNRTQMHSGIRGATEVLQQEVGQAGRIALPVTVTVGAGGSTGGAATDTLPVTSTTGMFVGEKLTVGASTTRETVKITAINSGTSVSVSAYSSSTTNGHTAGEPVLAYGGFSAGIVPPGTTNGSTSAVLKLFGDINADGNMVYIEYTCDTQGGNLYRNSMAWDTATKLRATASQILLSNITANPNGTACFNYQTQTVYVAGANTDFVTDVAITLTVQTQNVDRVTNAYQTETKALLNVSPRNVFNAWELAGLGYADRIQDTPPTVTALLAGTGS